MLTPTEYHVHFVYVIAKLYVCFSLLSLSHLTLRPLFRARTGRTFSPYSEPSICLCPSLDFYLDGLFSDRPSKHSSTSSLFYPFQQVFLQILYIIKLIALQNTTKNYLGVPELPKRFLGVPALNRLRNPQLKEDS